MSTGIISIGMTGLQAAQLGLQTTEHNITNVNTPGFTRQRIQQATNTPLLTGSGFIGQGVNVSSVERLYSSFQTAQVNQAQTSSSELDTFYAQISQIDNMLADSSSGLSPALQDFFKGVQQVAANPSALPARQAMVSTAQSLVARFQSLEARVSQLNDSVNSQITSTVSAINSYAQQIANLNGQIVIAQSSINQPANDLLDQRDQLVTELNKLIRVTTTNNSDGTYNVYIGSGQQLVIGSQSSTMTATPSAADPSKIAVGLKTVSSVQELPESLLNGGSLGGLLLFRQQSLDRVANDIGRNAASLALTFNAQSALGQDLLGQSSGDANFMANFFNISQPTVSANSRNTGTAVVSSALVTPPPIDGYYSLTRSGAGYTLTRQSDGQAWTQASLAALQAAVPASEGLTLTGATLAVGESTQVLGPAADSANFYTKLTNSDYQLGYDGANYTLTRLSDNVQWSNASLAALSTTVSGSEGFSLALSSGAMLTGDSFLIRPVHDAAKNITVNASVAADPRLVAAAMPVRTSAGANNTGSGAISAGQTVLGFSAASIGAAGVTVTYASAGNTLSFAGVLPAGTNISVTAGGVTTVYPPGSATITYTPGAQISLAGVSFAINGNPNNGDTFSLVQNTGAVSDGRNVLALGKLQTQNTMSGKTASFQSAYAQLVSDTGNKTREVEVTGQAQQSLLQQSESARDALSGVNLDEEAANLIRYQQAYQASAKMLEIGSKLFDVILSLKS